MRKNLPVTNNEYVLGENEVIVTQTDLKGCITYCSETFLKSSGFSRSEAMGAPQNLVRHPDMPAAAFADLWETIESGKPWTGIVKNRRKNGDFYWVRANATPLVTNGSITGYLSVRVKPTREEIDAASALYAAINEDKAKNVKISGGEVLRTGLFGRIASLLRLPLATRFWLMLAPMGLLFALLTIGALLAPEENSKLIAAGAAIGALVSVGLAFYLSYFFARPLRELIAVANRVARCESNTRFPAIGDHELQSLSKMLNQMNANQLGVVADTQLSIASMSAATTEVARGNMDLSSRTEEQASSLEETASAMEQLTSTVKQNAENARQANQLAAGASAVAVKGGDVVREVVGTMSGISASSRKIADIIGVIDGIAFQTNILALNAAVEAARAGEQGRGFAVVAGEVRNLAQRSAAAAKEIKELITDSTHKVDAGTKLVDDAGRTMDEIVASVRRVTDIMAEITAASQEQSSGIDEVCTAVSQMDEVTQQNAALVEEAAAAAESLEEQAGLILLALSIFNFGDSAVSPSAKVQQRKKTVRAGANADRGAIIEVPRPAVTLQKSAKKVHSLDFSGSAKSDVDAGWEEF